MTRDAGPIRIAGQPSPDEVAAVLALLALLVAARPPVDDPLATAPVSRWRRRRRAALTRP